MDEKDKPAVTLAISAMEEKTPSPSLEKFEKLDIKNASFSWTKPSPETGDQVEGTKGGVPVLHDITISLSPGKLHMLVGPVASVSIHGQRSSNVIGSDINGVLFRERALCSVRCSVKRFSSTEPWTRPPFASRMPAKM